MLSRVKHIITKNGSISQILSVTYTFSISTYVYHILIKTNRYFVNNKYKSMQTFEHLRKKPINYSTITFVSARLLYVLAQ